MSKHAHYPARPCYNCQTPLQEGWQHCPRCGQKNDDLALSIGHVLEEVAEGIWHFDSKLWATVKALFARPGKLTRDFLEGRRVAYVPPIRLYVFVSAVFFLLANMLLHKVAEEGDENLEAGFRQGASGRRGVLFSNQSREEKRLQSQRDSVAVEARLQALVTGYKGIILSASDAGRLAGLPHEGRLAAVADSLMARANRDPAIRETFRQDRVLDSAFKAHLLSPDMGLLLRPLAGGQALALRLETLNDSLPLDSARLDTLLHQGKPAQQAFLDRHGATGLKQKSWVTKAKLYERQLNGEQNPFADANLQHTIMKAASLIMFLLMPLVGLLLYGLFFRRRRYYTEHLIHSIHLHTAAFVAIILLLILPSYFGAGDDVVGWTTSILLVIGLPLYVLLSMKRVYGQGWARTLPKFIASLLIYGMMVAACGVFLVVYGFFSI